MLLLLNHSRLRTLRASFTMQTASRRMFSKDSIDAATLPFKAVVVAPHSSATHLLHGSTAENTLKPAVIVLQEWWGVNDQIVSHAQRIANNTGAIAIIPDLYNGKVTADSEEAKHMMDNLDWPAALSNLEQLAHALQKPPKDAPPFLFKDRKVGSIGFCMGGALSLALAARMAEKTSPLRACVSFYGTPSTKLIDVSKIPSSTPVQAHFGALDGHLGFSDIKTAHKLAESWDLTVKKLGGAHAHGFHSLESNVYVHEGLGHAFMNENGSKVRDVGGEVDKTWEKVFKFLVEHLKTV
ncbi:hypothetical protein HDU81_003953 [Chytriomyces hyalinus]|nr:hypothetical protein HDU81_003953 [Chytriomyces hyalinus]